MSLLEIISLLSIPVFTLLTYCLRPYLYKGEMRKSISQYDVSVIVGLVIIAAVGQYAMGRSFFGNMDLSHLISLDTKSQFNSQTFFDQYAFSHIIHGFIFFYFFRWILKKHSVGTWLMLSVMVETFWEVIENTNFVINRYREGTVSLDYYGDSMINSASDTLMCILGFYVATKLAPKYVIALAIFMELLALWWIRDNLTLNVIMLVYPLQAIRNWQSAG